MAIALARSVLRWNEHLKIRLALITDRPRADCPKDLRSISWTTIGSDEFGTGFTPKLFLDQLAPGPQSLFIDADCLCVKPLSPVFEAFAGRPIGVVGRPIAEGEWFGDVAAVCGKLGVAALPRFNGGVYYLEKGAACSAVYETARSLLPRYDELGFVRLRGRENDEVLIAAAMALHGLSAMPEDGSIMHTALEAPGGVFVDVIRGRSLLLNPKDHPKHFDWMPLEVMQPAIVHFLGSNADEHPYRTEIEALKFLAGGWLASLARLYADILYGFPLRTARWFKDTFRPLYRFLFGVRPVKASAR